jgi:hypothetical protein
MNTKTYPVFPAQILPPERMPGVSVGDCIDVVGAEMAAVMAQAGGNVLKAVQIGLGRMHASGLITDADLARLEKVSVIVLTVEEGKRKPEDAATELDRIYLEALADPSSSTMGVTMIGTTYSARSKQTAAAAGLMGMLVGAMLTGNPWGAAVGGLVGYYVVGGCKRF